MSPVHVLVSASEQDEQRYASAFAGAIDVYRFRTNVEAFERLTSAGAPIDVLVITPSQEQLFNMTAAQFVERLSVPAIAGSPNLAGLQVVVVGEQAPALPRVQAVATIDDAIRLIKFGHVEAAPQPQPQLPPPAPAPVAHASAAPAGAPTPAEFMTSLAGELPTLAVSPGPVEPPAGEMLSGSVISAIWDAPDPAELAARRAAAASPAARAVVGGGPAPAAAQQHHEAPASSPDAQGHHRQLPRGASPARARHNAARHAPVAQAGGHAAAPSGPPQLFAHVGAAPAAGAAVPAAQDADGDAGLEPARHFELRSRGAYRGRNAKIAATHDLAATMPAPDPHGHPAMPVPGTQQDMQVPPQLASQIQQIVYPHAAVAGDPLLGFSAGVQQQVAQQHAAEAQLLQAPFGMPAAVGHGMNPHYPQQVPAAPAGDPMLPQMAGQQQSQRKRGMLGRVRERVIEAERAPLTPNIPAGHAPHGWHAPAPTMHAPGSHQPLMHAAPPARQGETPFDASEQLLRRAESAGVSFG